MAKKNKKRKKAISDAIVAEQTRSSLLTLPAVHLGILALMTAIVYSPTIHVPFYFDDFKQIIENPVIQNTLDLGNIANYSTSRFVGYVTFAFDQAIHGNLPQGFHLTNTLIHLFSGWALYGFLMALINSPVLHKQKTSLTWLPLIASLIFVLHPLQTQAVTYIVQRLASLTGMFYISSMALYAWARILTHKASAQRWLFLFSLSCAILAIFTKQNALTLPAAILLIELLFFQQLASRHVWRLFITSMIAAAILITLVNIDPVNQWTRESPVISRPDYFATQVLVLWRYVGLFLVPANQRLEYDVALQTEWFDPVVILALILHISLILVAFRFWRKLPLLCFGILFFYLAHLVESGFIPISDFMFEHRTYLPNVGLSILAAAGLISLLQAPALQPAVLIGTPIIIVIASALTFERNQLWAKPIEFLKAETQLSPNKERVWTSLGKEMMRRNQLKEASVAFSNALTLATIEDGMEVRPATLMNAILLHHYLGEFDDAFELQRLLPLDSISAIERSKLHEVRGISFLNLQKPEQAKIEFTESIHHSPNLNAEAGLATVAILRGDKQMAEARARQVLSQEPKNILANRVLKELGLTTNQ
jgi:protein O-mannosyl-transferase